MHKNRLNPYIVLLCTAGIQPTPGATCEMKTLEGKPFRPFFKKKSKGLNHQLSCVWNNGLVHYFVSPLPGTIFCYKELVAD